MTDNIEARLASLRTQQQEAARRYAQAEAKVDAVRAKKGEIHKSLKDLGFDSPEAARARATEISAEIEEVMAQIEEKVQGL